MKIDRAIRSTRVVTPEGERPAAMLIGDGKIVDVIPHDAVPENAPLDDWGSLAILPGLVDTHVHCNEPGRTEWEGFETATKSAIAGGVTTIVDMPLNSTPATIHVGALQDKLGASRDKRYCDVAFWAGLVGDERDYVSIMIAAGALGFKAFLCPSGVDDFPAVEKSNLEYAMPELAAAGVPLLVHCEIVDNVQPLGSRKYTDYLASRPPRYEQAAIRQMIDLCRLTCCRVHVVHLADADSLPMLIAARQEGLPITVETCPHYLHFSAEEIPDGATEFKCAPPIRHAANRERLWQALADGVIDLVASDHSPCPPMMKGRELGDFMSAWGGIASLQLGLSVIWTSARRRGISLGQVAHWMATSPARLAGLSTTKGEISAGRHADFAVFDPESSWVVDPLHLYHRHKLTPYAGAAMQGRVRATYLHGAVVCRDGKMVADNAIGYAFRRGDDSQY